MKIDGDAEICEQYVRKITFSANKPVSHPSKSRLIKHLKR